MTGKRKRPFKQSSDCSEVSFLGLILQSSLLVIDYLSIDKAKIECLACIEGLATLKAKVLYSRTSELKVEDLSS